MALAEIRLPVVSRRDLVLVPALEAEPAVVWLGGEHDMSTAAALSETLDQGIALGRDVVVDLSGVEFMAATTVGVIVRARESLRLRSRSLVLRSPSRCARRVLELCGVADLIDPTGADVSRETGPADALCSWVAAPGTVRLDPYSSPSAALPADISDSNRLDHVVDIGALSSAVGDEPADRANVAGGGGP